MLFEKSASGDAAERELLRSDYPMYPSDWSRSGKDLLYTENSPSGGFDVWALSVGGASKATPILQSPAAEMHGEFSPNGRFIAFTSDESGRNEVYVQNFVDTAIRRRVSTSGGGYPRWSRKGDELFYRSLERPADGCPHSVQWELPELWRAAARDAIDRTPCRIHKSLRHRSGWTDPRVGSCVRGTCKHLAGCTPKLASGVATLRPDAAHATSGTHQCRRIDEARSRWLR